MLGVPSGYIMAQYLTKSHKLSDPRLSSDNACSALQKQKNILTLFEYTNEQIILYRSHTAVSTLWSSIQATAVAALAHRASLEPLHKNFYGQKYCRDQANPQLDHAGEYLPQQCWVMLTWFLGKRL